MTLEEYIKESVSYLDEDNDVNILFKLDKFYSMFLEYWCIAENERRWYRRYENSFFYGYQIKFPEKI